MPVTIEPLGGLGNQLFVYALGRTLSSELGTTLDADLRNFWGYDWHSYELDSFRNSIDRTVNVSPRRIARYIYPVERRVTARVPWVSRRLTPDLHVSQTSLFEPGIMQARDGARLRGYFQSWKYFAEHSDVIRAEVRQLTAPSSWFMEMTDVLGSMSNWASVHVRRGTYLEVDNMGLAGPGYYRRALGLLDKMVGPMPLVVFSDDVSTARELIEGVSGRGAIFIDPVSDSRPIESMMLMSMSSHSIIANSTFSWWAAWLSDRPDRLVLYPRPWLDDTDFDERDLIAPEWIGVGRGE